MSERWTDDEVRAELEPALHAQLGSEARVASLERRPSRYRTSYPIEELEVRLEDGRALRLLFKDLARSGLDPAAIAAKPEFLYEPRREPELYARLLPAAGVAGATCYGVVARPESDRYWMFLEHVAGVELFQVGDRGTWEHVARWLAGAHERLADQRDSAEHLLRYDRELLELWPGRALEYSTGDEARGALARISEGYDAVVEPILELPPTVIHGEFYASNVLVDDPVAPQRVVAVDWEMAAVGPGLLDLAALVSGRGWQEADRAAIADAYREASPTYSETAAARFARGLDACRLHIALQWLGWSASWSPPAEHATNWLADAAALASALGIAD